MFTISIEIDNRGDYCGKCKQNMCLDPSYAGEHTYICCVFKKRIKRSLAGRKLCRVDECLKLKKD